jgi:hypothetical protein
MNSCDDDGCYANGALYAGAFDDDDGDGCRDVDACDDNRDNGGSTFSTSSNC